jgi:2-methylisocitrate lyase-like PEP mutase family enzyme
VPTVAEKRRTFRALHERGCFVIPNPWDIGSARYLQHLGFKALATTSSGAAWSLGYADGGVPFDAMIDHIGVIATASDVPVNADFINGFADAADDLGLNVSKAVAAGVAGLSIEDRIPGSEALYDITLAVERIAAAHAAAGDAVLVARTECYLMGHARPLDEAIARLTKFAEAGADCLFAPGVRKPDDIAAIVQAVAPKPVNVLLMAPGEATVASLAALGVRRISLGGALARMAWAGVQRAAKEIAEAGTFIVLADAAPGGPLNAFFGADAKERAP